MYIYIYVQTVSILGNNLAMHIMSKRTHFPRKSKWQIGSNMVAILFRRSFFQDFSETHLCNRKCSDFDSRPRLVSVWKIGAWCNPARGILKRGPDSSSNEMQICSYSQPWPTHQYTDTQFVSKGIRRGCLLVFYTGWCKHPFQLSQTCPLSACQPRGFASP